MAIPRTHLEPSLKDLYDYLDSVGSNLTSSVASGSAVALTTETPANVTSITLTPGTWDISGVVGYLPAASTSITVRQGGANTTSATLGALGTKYVVSSAAAVPTAVGQEHPIPTHRVTVTVNTTLYLVAQATFTVSTLGAYGIISARLVSK
jgi:hypothetical protein